MKAHHIFAVTRHGLKELFPASQSISLVCGNRFSDVLLELLRGFHFMFKVANVYVFKHVILCIDFANTQAAVNRQNRCGLKNTPLFEEIADASYTL